MLLAAVPSAIAVEWIYGAIAAILTPNALNEDYYRALEAYQQATAQAKMNLGFLAFFGVITYVIWKWRKGQIRSNK